MNITRRKQVLLALGVAALGVAALAVLAIAPFGAFATGSGADAPDPAPAQPRTPGTLTHDEYAAAVFTNMACLDAQGIAHTTPIYDPASERYTYTVTTAAPGGADSPVESCWRLHERGVAAQWAMEHPRTGDVKSATLAVACAKAQGIEAATVEELVALWEGGRQESRPALRMCLEVAPGVDLD